MQSLEQSLHAIPLRDMPWRRIASDGTIDPYLILVSEIMLQQTQVQRVIPKYAAFIDRFPSVQTLARAPLSDVLQAWSGLGYNRRAKYLHQAAQTIVRHHDGVLPSTIDALVQLPGVGVNTAGAILAYAYNQPTIFIETNVRTVYIHHFFHDQASVTDKVIREKLEVTIDTVNPRQFYWRLMDYGTQLKQELGNLSRKSKTYGKQSRFDGSRRQIRGEVLKALTNASRTHRQLESMIIDERLNSVLEQLQVEGLITKKKQHYQLG